VLKIEQVQEIVAENKLKNKVSSLEDYWDCCWAWKTSTMPWVKKV
jgi:hypothetical protein